MSKEETKLTQKQYLNIHQLLRYHHGLAKKCDMCGCEGTRRRRWNIEWALKKGRKYSLDINDYMQLCSSCHRKYDFTEEQREKLRRINIGSKNRNKPIKQYTLDGELVREFESTISVERTIGISSTAIANCVMGRSSNAGGFIWKR